MESQQTRMIRIVLDTAIRRRGLIIISIMISLVAGLGFYLIQPKSYKGETLLSYQQQKINPAKMSPDVQVRISTIVSTLSQVVTSRTSLEQIINDLDLYEEARKNLPMEDVIEMMRASISIKPSKRGDTFVISYTGKDPKQAARTTNVIAARFIEENLKYREERASETSKYTMDELEMAKEMLDRKEAVMRDYKLKYYNEMPEQRVNNLMRLNTLQEQYQGRQESIQDLERTRVLLQDQINVRRQLVAENEKLAQTLSASSEKSAGPIESDQARLERLQAALLILLEKYTENHPSVRTVKLQIAQIEQKLADQPETAEGAPVIPTGSFDKVIFQMELQLKEIGLSIENLEREKKDLANTIEQYDQWIASAPVREAEWSALTREYDELKRHYDDLVSQNLQARSALNLERKQKGSQFKIEDPARVPEKPSKPDFLMIMVMALAAGCALGGGLAFCLEFLDNSFRDPSDIEDEIKVEVIGCVPLIPLKHEIVRKRLLTTGGICFYLLCGGLLISLFYYFWRQGLIIV